MLGKQNPKIAAIPKKECWCSVNTNKTELPSVLPTEKQHHIIAIMNVIDVAIAMIAVIISLLTVMATAKLVIDIAKKN